MACVKRQDSLPLIEELSPAPDPLSVLSRFADLERTAFFDSALRDGRHGQFSFLTADPYRWFQLETPRFGFDPFSGIAPVMRASRTERIPGLPPFQGGAAGLMSYELGHAWERLPDSRFDEFRFPALAVGVFDWTIAWDHAANRAWIISQGFPAESLEERRKRAANRISWVQSRLEGTPRERTTGGRQLAAETLSPQSAVESVPSVTSTFSRQDYVNAVNGIIHKIRAGDIFQANLTQRMLVPTLESPLSVYSRLRLLNPAPFAAYFTSSDWAILSSSPERFVKVRDGCVETRPIKGTRPRSSSPAVDEELQWELRNSEKDRAENIMIVDLLRNDLSKVCRPGSVYVPELCAVETYETVHHLVSAVVGQLDEERSVFDLFAAAFPGGSITGAPKVRAMEILADIEPVARGPYCGSLFYLGFDGSCDSSILIRTMLHKDGWLQFGVGGGITASSDAEAEYQETLDKAAGMLRVIE